MSAWPATASVFLEVISGRARTASRTTSLRRAIRPSGRSCPQPRWAMAAITSCTIPITISCSRRITPRACGACGLANRTSDSLAGSSLRFSDPSNRAVVNAHRYECPRSYEAGQLPRKRNDRSPRSNPFGDLGDGLIEIDQKGHGELAVGGHRRSHEARTHVGDRDAGRPEVDAEPLQEVAQKRLRRAVGRAEGKPRYCARLEMPTRCPRRLSTIVGRRAVRVATAPARSPR